MTPDWSTLLLQLVNFLVLAWLLRRFLFAPVKRVIEQRRQLAAAALADAERQQEQAAVAEREFRTRAAALEAERQAMLRDLHTRLERERQAALVAAQAEAAKLVADVRVGLDTERQAALAGLRAQLADLAVAMARAVLVRLDPGPLTESLFDAAATYLDGLPAGERDRLRAELAAADAPIVVVTPLALSDRLVLAWQARLANCLGGGNPVRFAVEPDLVAGLELRLPSSRLTFSVADMLARARAELVEHAPAA